VDSFDVESVHAQEPLEGRAQLDVVIDEQN
jgi:hypothetical protein